ncbi:Senescence regulator [Quillaja saponaria]|uniref:Senescence regulator n=1 Tax=Quillaja saponaria TaxID=32244 RepID=A0AAD7M0H4_QUISA|nr:Senescence regulator [Quillaja saponaria]
MAKGRKLTTSRSERLLGSYSYGHSQESSVMDTSELAEEDVWSMVDEMVDREDRTVNNSQSEFSSRATVDSNGSQSIRSRRRITREVRQGSGGLSSAFEDSGMSTTSSRILHQLCGHDSVASPREHHMATSAPVNVPDWSKILRVDSVESMHDMEDGLDDMESEMVPPHEYLVLNQKMAATSVFEGVGRTLKGRDMRRVRDAVWSQTGFNG